MPLFAWIIIGILSFIALLVIILLIAKVELRISYRNELTISAKFLFLRFKLYPEKQKKKKKKTKGKKPQVASPKPPAKTEEKKKSDIIPKLFEYRETVLGIVKEFASVLHFRFLNINIKIATDDAAKTAITYSLAVQGVSYLVSFLDNYSNIDVTKNSSINVYTDFLSEESSLDGSVLLYTRVYHALPVLMKVVKLVTQIKLKSEDTKNGTN
ncbi:MAG: DUF2953 domain-containing protein [Clostridia bacterium]|nr:DUF2953 domain-containing protein [Clostridia bacterium]